MSDFISMTGYYLSQAAAARGEKGRTFDWITAAKIIKEHQPELAEAGLIEDWGWTAGTIWECGAPPKDHYTYLASLWATPTLVIDGEEIPCFVETGTNGWDSGTYWPPEALVIVNGEGDNE